MKPLVVSINTIDEWVGAHESPYLLHDEGPGGAGGGSLEYGHGAGQLRRASQLWGGGRGGVKRFLEKGSGKECV